MTRREGLEPDLESHGQRLLLIRPRGPRVSWAQRVSSLWLSQQPWAHEPQTAAPEAQGPIFQSRRGDRMGQRGSSVHTPSDQLPGAVTLHGCGSWCRERRRFLGSPRETFAVLFSGWCASNCENIREAVYCHFLSNIQVFSMCSVTNPQSLEADNITGCPQKYLLGHQGIKHLFPGLVI